MRTSHLAPGRSACFPLQEEESNSPASEEGSRKQVGLRQRGRRVRRHAICSHWTAAADWLTGWASLKHM